MSLDQQVADLVTAVDGLTAANATAQGRLDTAVGEAEAARDAAVERWQGAWDVAATYDALDIVSHEGSSWIATGAIAAGVEPGVGAAWELVAQKGDQGDQGDQGIQGIQGIEGPPGQSGAEGFLDLTDSPSAYTGQSGKVVSVNSGETGLEFTVVSTDPAGSDTQVQFNDGGAFGGDAGLTFNKTAKALTLTGATVTTSQPVLDLSQTWNDAAVTFSGMKLNVTDTASASESLLMDLQRNNTRLFGLSKTGNIDIDPSNATAVCNFKVGGRSAFRFFGGTGWGVQPFNIEAPGGLALVASGSVSLTLFDTILTRRAAANLRLGAADAAAPIAQTLSVQSVSSGTTDTAGANFTIDGSQGTGTGAGGSIVFRVAPAGSSGTAQNALEDALTIDSTRRATFASDINFTNSPSYLIVNNSFVLLLATTALRTYLNFEGASDNAYDLGSTTRYWRNLLLKGYAEVIEMTAPAAPAANGVRIYAEDDGAGKTRLMALFATGAAQQIAIEP